MVTSPQSVVVLGSTGSIGTQALELLRAFPERFRVQALAAGRNLDLLARQAVELQVPVVAAAVERDELRAAIEAYAAPGYRPELVTGPAAAETVAGLGVDTVLNGITGAIGLRPTLAALAAGSRLALANKESLIVGGALVTALAAPGQIVPVDSEHSAILQCLPMGRPQDVRRLVLTASGGPFRGRTRAELADVTPAQALAHPTWDMGRVISTNSATLVNKGLEVIEAHLLFGVPFEAIDVVVHPTSVVHSMVELVDGSTILKASPPSMLIPIALGFTWPDRLPGVDAAVDWALPQRWDFAPLDDEAFPAVRLARQVGRAGGTFPAVYNAANEVCVDAFHDGRIGFLDIVDTVERVVSDRADSRLGDTEGDPGALGVDDVLAADQWARDRARQVLGLDERT
mgnify:CR=1 FL=1